MQAVAQVLAIENPPQFIGYWGYGNALGLRTCLSNILGTVHEPKPIQYLDCASEIVLAALSAGEHFTSLNHADAWCKVEGETLILGREAFGKVPLYWTQVGSVLWFASRSQLLFPLLQDKTINFAGLYGYSCFSYVPTPFSAVENIFAVPSGTELVWQGQGDLTNITLKKTRRLLEWREHPQQLMDEETAIAQIQTLLQQAIQRQINDLTHEPVGVLLSGGLDSSIVAALLVQAGVNVRAYTLDFGSEGTPEYPYAEQVAQWLKIPLTKVKAHPKEIRNALIPTVQALDLPFGDGVTVPLFLLAQAASQDVSVIFNGEGGDQLFAGWTNKPLIAAGLYQPEEAFDQQYLRTFHRLWGYEAQLYQPDFCAEIQTLNPQDWLQEALDPSFTSSFLHRLRRANLMLKGAQNIHPRATQIGFAHGLKVRSPFCDLPLAQWTFGLSSLMFLKDSCEKYILKRAVEDWLPPDIVWRTKRGMGVPLTSWCFNRFWQDLGHWLNPATLRQEGYWQPHLAAQIVSGRLGGKIQGRRMGETLWLLMMWEIWRSEVFGGSSTPYTWDHPFWLPLWLWRYRQKWKP
jgi:asparagine synthase (glutamine-hydrolysing)